MHPRPGSDPELPDLCEQLPPEDEPVSRPLVSVPSLPPAPALPSFDLKALEASGPQGALLVPVLQQFGMMQQQMMDQFQQSMQMVVQVFASMHRDQMSTLQRELDQIHHLTRELNELQAELRARRGPAPSRNGAGARLPEPPPALPARHPLPPAAHGNTAPPLGGAAPAPPPAAPAGPSGEVPNTGDMHEWLNQRILTLQREREGRWQKILGFVMGK
jgi:hypothetical protein